MLVRGRTSKLEDEIERAVQLTDTMALDDISGFRDRYREALEELIEARAEGQQPPAPAEDEERGAGKVVDLMAALNASVKAARKSHGEDATVHEMRPRKRTATKQTAAKKATAKKVTARKSTARKGTARRTSAKKRSAS